MLAKFQRDVSVEFWFLFLWQSYQKLCWLYYISVHNFFLFFWIKIQFIYIKNKMKCTSILFFIGKSIYLYKELIWHAGKWQAFPKSFLFRLIEFLTYIDTLTYSHIVWWKALMIQICNKSHHQRDTRIKSSYIKNIFLPPDKKPRWWNSMHNMSCWYLTKCFKGILSKYTGSVLKTRITHGYWSYGI